MSNSNNSNDLVNAIGSLAEMTLIFFRAILGGGGTFEEALTLTREYLYVITHPKNKEEEHGETDV